MRRAPLFALAFLLFLALPFAVAAGDDEILGEFQRYFRKFKDTPTRVEAILALEGVESAGVVDVLLPVLVDEENDVVRAAIRVLAAFETAEPVAEIFARLAVDKREEVRSGLLCAIAEGGYQGPPDALLTCLADRSWEVRRRALEALATRGAEDHVESMVPLCADPEPAVRSAALDGLARLKSQRVIDAAIAALADETWQVRASAAGALKAVRHKRSIEPLIARMESEQGRLVIDYGAALEAITGKRFDQRVELWRRFWNEYGAAFEIPTDAELAKMLAARAEANAQYAPRPGAVTYHGVDTPSRSIVFIIDVSGSMEDLVVEKERFQDGGYASFARIEIVKTELARTVEGIEPYVNFNILAFATEVKSWKPRLVAANVLNKKSALDWIARLEAIGGTSKEELSRVGLVGSANLEAGKTNTYGALMQGLGVAGRGSPDEGYQVEVDTIFFLSDGRPTVGDLVDPDDILREVTRANELRKVVIHTIALGDFHKEFMRRLAVQNGGVFVDLGR